MADKTGDLPPLSAQINPDVPHAARIWNYWMGGKDNYEADRTAGDMVAEIYPEIAIMARESRHFLNRVVRYLTGVAGIRQFLDIGTGLPTMQNTHEIAQGIEPESRIVYVDNDPLVLAHARALLRNTTPEGITTYVDADYHNPELILSRARNVLNFTKPIAVMFMGVLGYVEDLAVMKEIVSKILSAVPSGSILVLWDGTNTSESVVAGSERLMETGAVPYYLRSVQELGECFDGLQFVDPGLVPITQWRPDSTDAVAIDAYGAVARKP